MPSLFLSYFLVVVYIFPRKLETFLAVVLDIHCCHVLPQKHQLCFIMVLATNTDHPRLEDFNKRPGRNDKLNLDGSLLRQMSEERLRSLLSVFCTPPSRTFLLWTGEYAGSPNDCFTLDVEIEVWTWIDWTDGIKDHVLWCHTGNRSQQLMWFHLPTLEYHHCLWRSDRW